MCSTGFRLCSVNLRQCLTFEQVSLWAPSAMGCLLCTCPVRTISKRWEETQQTWLVTAQTLAATKYSCVPCQGDVVLHCSHVIELVTKLAMMANKVSYVNISPGRWGTSGCSSIVTVPAQQYSSPYHVLLFVTSCAATSIRFAVARGKEGIIDFVRGSELKVAKGKQGHLLVVSQRLYWCHVWSLQGGRVFFLC